MTFCDFDKLCLFFFRLIVMTFCDFDKLHFIHIYVIENDLSVISREENELF